MSVCLYVFMSLCLYAFSVPIRTMPLRSLGGVNVVSSRRIEIEIEVEVEKRDEKRESVCVRVCVCVCLRVQIIHFRILRLNLLSVDFLIRDGPSGIIHSDLPEQLPVDNGVLPLQPHLQFRLGHD